MRIVIGILLAIILGFIWLLSRPDEVQTIDNSEGQIICGDTNKPCIKNTLYTYWNNCGDCPCHLQDCKNLGE